MLVAISLLSSVTFEQSFIYYRRKDKQSSFHKMIWRKIMKDDALLKEVQEIIEKLKPEWGSGLSHCHKDSDFVRKLV